jgi:DNA repair protein RadA/Sms
MRHRLSTGIGWLDEALGTPETPGMIAGSVILMAGNPGSGKSTLLRQVASATDLEILYNTGEECFEQVKMALESKDLNTHFDLSNYRNVDELIAAIEKHRYQILILDSIQNLFTEANLEGNPVAGGPGGAKQLTAVAEKLTKYAKATGTIILAICHSTKAGALSGPNLLEYIIDTTVKIEVEEGSRSLFCQKNRWGNTQIFFELSMGPMGLSLAEPSAPKAKTSKVPKSVKGQAREIFASKPDQSKEEFVEAVIEATGTSKATANMYYYMLQRE